MLPHEGLIPLAAPQPTGKSIKTPLPGAFACSSGAARLPGRLIPGGVWLGWGTGAFQELERASYIFPTMSVRAHT